MDDNFDYSGVAPHWVGKLKQAVTNIQDLKGKTVAMVVKIGEQLLEVKEALNHGQFGAFCVYALSMTTRSAENYMNLAVLARFCEPELIEQLPLSIAYEIARKFKKTS
jgi:hypothetical protein